MRRPRFAAAVAGLAVLGACGGPEATDPGPVTSGDLTEVTIGLTYTPDIQFSPFYAALENGYYADAGLDVTLRHHGQSESLFGALTSGEEDVVIAGGAEMLQAHAEGVDVVYTATIYQTYPVVLIAPEESGITSPADLEGATVGSPGPYGENYFGLTLMLADSGLGEDEVTSEFIGFTQTSALLAGHVDAVIGYANNEVVQLERSGFAVRAIDLTEGEIPLVSAGIGVSGELADTDPETVEAVVAASLRGVEAVMADPEAAVETAAAHVPSLGAPEQAEAALAVLEATIELYGSPESDGLGRVDLDRWRAMAEFMGEHGLLEGDVDLDRVVTTEYLPG